MNRCGPDSKQKIDPEQSAFPNLHTIDGNWIKEPRGEYAGMPIRMELAARFVAAFITSGRRMSNDIMISDSLELADELIEKYNQ